MSHLKLLQSLTRDQHYVSQIPDEMIGRFISLKDADGTMVRAKYASSPPSATEGLTVLTVTAVGQAIRFALPHHTVVNFDPQEGS